MPTVVAVRFKDSGKLYHFSPGGLGLHRLDRVVVETAAGISLGRVVTEPQDKDASQLSAPVRRVLRKATADDLRRERRARERAAQVLESCRRRVKELAIGMHAVEADCTIDGSKVSVTFTAEERVDFRQLVKGLTTEFHCRVEMRQVGARDEAKALDGIGPCGQRLCCSRWLTEFQPISIKMAKLQHLALNPGKLAGACGRLKCCLRYEIENYVGAERELPTMGSKVFTVDGEARVVGLNLLERKVALLFDEPTPRWYPVAEIFHHNGCQNGIACASGKCSGGACANRE